MGCVQFEVLPAASSIVLGQRQQIPIPIRMPSLEKTPIPPSVDLGDCPSFDVPSEKQRDPNNTSTKPNLYFLFAISSTQWLQVTHWSLQEMNALFHT